MVKNGQKWLKIEFSGKWQDNGVVIAWNSFLSADIIATAPTFVNIADQWVAHEQAQLLKNGQKLNFRANVGKTG